MLRGDLLNTNKFGRCVWDGGWWVARDVSLTHQQMMETLLEEDLVDDLQRYADSNCLRCRGRGYYETFCLCSCLFGDVKVGDKIVITSKPDKHCSDCHGTGLITLFTSIKKCGCC